MFLTGVYFMDTRVIYATLELDERSCIDNLLIFLSVIQSSVR